MKIMCCNAVLLMFASLSFAQLSPENPRKIIDMHLHASRIEDFVPASNERMKPGEGQLFANPVTGKPSDARTNEDLIRLTIEALERYNIVKAMTSGSLEEVYRWKAAAPDRIIASLMFSGRPSNAPRAENPTPPLQLIRQEYDAGRLIGLGEITAQYQGIQFDGPELKPYFALAEELDMPVGVHTGLSEPGTPFGCCPHFRVRLGNPLLLEEVLVRHPKLRLYLNHAGDVFQQETIALMHMYPQVYAELGAINWAIPRGQFHYYLKTFIRAGFGKRLMFGSDQMLWPELIGMGIEAIETAEFLTEEQKEDIFYNNAARFLRLEEGAEGSK